MKLYQKLFASKYDFFMAEVEKTFQPIRKELIGNLEGDILEVGSGTGINFEHYNPKAKVLALEPSIFMMTQAENKLPKITQITTCNLGIDDPKLDFIIENNSLDYIVCTLVLCTIPDQKLAFEKFKKWLKPTGKLIVLEHIHAQNKPARVLYNLVNPVWKIFGEGCNINRDTDVSIKNAGFTVESEKYFKKSINFYQAVFTVSTPA